MALDLHVGCWLPCCPLFFAPSLDALLHPRLLSFSSLDDAAHPRPLHAHLTRLAGDSADLVAIARFPPVNSSDSSINMGDLPGVHSEFAKQWSVPSWPLSGSHETVTDEMVSDALVKLNARFREGAHIGDDAQP